MNSRGGRMVMIHYALASLISLALVASAIAASPSTLPTIPALLADSQPLRPFIVDGVIRTSSSDGFGFHFATDGARELCAIFDAHDGTPIYLSDGQQTLVYDLSNERVVRVPTCRADVKIG